MFLSFRAKTRCKSMLFSYWMLRLFPLRKWKVVQGNHHLVSVVADFAGYASKRVERNICKLRRFREVVMRVEIQVLFGSDCHRMLELKEKW